MYFRKFSYWHHLTSAQLLGKKRGKVIFRNEEHSFVLFFPNVVIRSHVCHVKNKADKLFFQESKPVFTDKLSLLRVIKEHMNFSSNPSTLVERLIEDTEEVLDQYKFLFRSLQRL